VIGAAKGLHMVATETPREYLADYVGYRTKGTLPWNAVGLPVAILPGLLASLHPSEFWPHAVTFALFLTSLGLLWRAIGLPAEDADLLLLGWASSSALLSFSIAGLPYISNTLPFALALWVVLKPRSWIAALVLSAVAIESSWHVQELGRTVFLVFVSAALLLPGLRPATRIVFGVAGAVQVLQAMRFHSANTSRYAAMSVPDPYDGARSLVALGGHFLHQRPDLFALVPLGLVAVAFTGKRRWFWMAVIGAQIVLLWLLAANTGPLQGVGCVWPRRALLLMFLCLAALLAACSEAPRLRPWIRIALLTAAALQLTDTALWARRPLNGSGNGEEGFTLPYTETWIPLERGHRTYLDYTTPFFMVDWYLEMRDAVDRGEKILLLYNSTSYDENFTNPAAVLERLYLHLGHQRFVDQVFVFDGTNGHWDAVPVRRPGQFPDVLASISDPSVIRGYWLHHLNDERRDWEKARQHKAEMEWLVKSLNRRFRIDYQPSSQSPYGARELRRFTLAVREQPTSTTTSPTTSLNRSRDPDNTAIPDGYTASYGEQPAGVRVP
jgi:hypothetical protein